MAAVRTAEDAQAEIGHHFPTLIQIAADVHNEFRANCRAIATFIEPRTKACIYRDAFIRKLRDYCDLPTNGAHLHRKNQLVLVGLESRYAMRVKQLASGFAVGVSPTRASELYDSNEMPAYASDLFPDAPEVTLLYLGWSVPENAPGQINLYLVCNDSNREVLWVIPLSENDEGRGIQAPLPVENDNGDDSGIRVRVKRDKKRDHG